MTFVLVGTPTGAPLESGLGAWSVELKKLKRPTQLLVVDSKEDSAETVARLAEKHSLPFQFLKSEPGFGSALRVALAAAKEPFFFYTSLEYPYLPFEIHEFLRRIEEKDPESGLSLHLVTGYRSLTPVPAGRAFWGKLGRLLLKIAVNVPSEPLPGWLGRSSHRFSRWMRILFGLRIGDVNSHFKLFRREIFKRIPLQSSGEFVHGEILAKANFLGCYMDEVSIVKQAGPIKVASVIPDVTRDTYREMKLVLNRPDFGPWPLPEETPPQPESSPEPVASPP
jgi:hypothetical protein